MNNESRIKGNGNFVLQGAKNSKINIKTSNLKSLNKQKLTWIAFLISILGLIATIIIGWENIIKFFTK